MILEVGDETVKSPEDVAKAVKEAAGSAARPSCAHQDGRRPDASVAVQLEEELSRSIRRV